MDTIRGNGSLVKAAIVAACAAVLPAGLIQAAPPVAKNVIVMISDGQGFNTVKATDYYVGAAAVFEGTGWVKYGMQTSSANNPAGYNPASMAANFNYAKSGATDSASAATAMYTGVKNYDGEVNWTTDDKPLRTMFENAALVGKSIGAVSSVQFSHATPAAVYGHNSSRNNYSEIALEAINGSNPNSHNGNYNAGNYNGNLKVVMGTGHPDFNADGQAQTPNHGYVGGSQAWTDLGNGTNGWTRIDTKQDFADYASGVKSADKLFGVAQNISTLQQGRTNPSGNFDPMLTNQPTLVQMTQAALRTLDNNPNGFAVMIEGGAVDWANHAGQADRMLEEQIDYNNSVKAVADYLDANTNGNNWSNTLVISTADHECGHVWGDSTPASFFDVNSNGTYEHGTDYPHVENMGVGVMPGVGHYSGNHTNALVPFYAKGPGAELFAGYVIGTDSNLVQMYNIAGDGFDGQYIDNTSIYGVSSAVGVPEPGTLGLMALAGLAGLARRRRA